MMLTTRDRENRVNALQGAKGGFSKTPGGKLGENEISAMNLGGKSGFKTQADAFKTPLGPRSRVPLGGKDTNVKAKTTINFNDPLQTNKPEKATPSSMKKRARRQTRLSTTQAQAKGLTEEDDDVPEIEYIPPAPQELPDIPEDYVRIDMGKIKQNLFKDVHSTPIYTEKQRQKFKKLTYRDEKKEEEDVLKELESIVSDMKIGLEKEATQPIVKKKTSSYSGATKSSLAKRGPVRPPSSNSARPPSVASARPPSAAGSGRPHSAASGRSASAASSRPASVASSRPLSTTGIKKKTSATVAAKKSANPWTVGAYYDDPDHYYKDPRPDRKGVFHPLGKHGLYSAKLTNKVAPILDAKMAPIIAKLESGECTTDDFDYSNIEEEVLRRAENPIYPAKYDFEARMRDLFRMDEPEDDDEVFQIPLEE
ncbi:hypothetical protein TWF730_000291 [Orbilia blumenaviensis]|uniref:Uncharacterized protein n=1 Tax=Orbilia blumenaviensis TaxID=1796055 RepID=A0AAV9VND9_9PEZI